MLHQFKGDTRGLTLAELVVSLAIVAIILTVVVRGQSTYTEAAALTNLADEIGATISQAQVYGIGVKEFVGSPGEFSASYGLSLSLRTPTGPLGSPTAYIYFADRDPAGPAGPTKHYDGDWTCLTGGTNECILRTSILRGNTINDLCAIISALPDDCGVNIQRIDISFSRPSTEANIIFFNNAGAQTILANMIGARIELRSPSGLLRSVRVYKTGQVTVQ